MLQTLMSCVTLLSAAYFESSNKKLHGVKQNSKYTERGPNNNSSVIYAACQRSGV